jgi:DMSO/TMAO reductase YedYZ molybdopterin-dependent catalytic subunit
MCGKTISSYDILCAHCRAPVQPPREWRRRLEFALVVVLAVALLLTLRGCMYGKVVAASVVNPESRIANPQSSDDSGSPTVATVRPAKLTNMLTLLALGLLVQSPAAASLTIDGDVSKPITLSDAEIAAMPQKSVKPTAHEQTGTFTGVPLRDLLTKAGVPAGGEIRGAAAAFRTARCRAA